MIVEKSRLRNEERVICLYIHKVKVHNKVTVKCNNQFGKLTLNKSQVALLQHTSNIAHTSKVCLGVKYLILEDFYQIWLTCRLRSPTKPIGHYLTKPIPIQE